MFGNTMYMIKYVICRVFGYLIGVYIQPSKQRVGNAMANGHDYERNENAGLSPMQQRQHQQQQQSERTGMA